MENLDDTNSFLFDMCHYEEIGDSSNKNSKSCNQGTVAEISIALEATKRGFKVFVPIGHSQKADIVLWNPPRRPLSIQVKKAVWQKDSNSYKFMIGSSKPSCANNPKDYGLRYKKYDKGDFDVLAAFIQHRESFVFYKLDSIAGKSTMRWAPAGNQPENNWDDLMLW